MPETTPPEPDPRNRFVARVLDRLDRSTFVRLVLSGPTPEAGGVRRILARPVELRGARVLSVTFREDRRDTTRNLTPAEVAAWLPEALQRQFRNGLLESTEGDWQLTQPAEGDARLVRHKSRQTEPPRLAHDRLKARALRGDAVDWLEALGLADPSGVVLPSRSDKVQQIDRYAEILGHLVAEAAWPAGSVLRVVDMGCGRGSLTFAAWQSLRRQREFPAQVTGIDARADLVDAANGIAQRLGLDGLEFRQGTIADAPLESPDLVIALHACNTATDDALRRGIESGARVLVVAPCCHQQLRPQLHPSAPFDAPLRHGLLAERLSEWLTDALRALFLEWAGYRVKVVEFVGSEHTPKNLLLAGVRTLRPYADTAVRDRILALKNTFGIGTFPLDPFLDR